MPTKIKATKTKPFLLAMTILDLPAGPTFKELQKQARSYLRELSNEEREKLREEAVSEKSDYKDDYVDKLDIYSQLLFTPRECQAYANMRIDAPGVRRVIARRALLSAMRGWNRLPEGMILPDVVRMEDAFLDGMSDEQIMMELQRIRKIR
jgi:hypothetical protein